MTGRLKRYKESSMSENNTNIPKMRFPGFTNAWEQRKAVDIFKSTTDKNHPELPVLSATQEYGMILREDTGLNISHDKKNEATYKRVLPGQFVIHLRSFQGGFAHSNIQGITSPAYTVMDFVEKEKHYDFFWKYVFSSKKFIKSLEKVTYGIRDGRSISYDDFSTMSFLFPSCGEQKAIGQFIQNLDHLITLHQRKLDHLQDEKKSLLQKMFPKDGADVPEIRFPGFTHAWEQRKLGDFIEDYIEKTTIQNQYPVLTSSQQIGIVLQEDYFANRQVTTDENIGYFVLPKGYFTYRSRSDNGVFVFNRNDLIDKGIISYFYPVFRVKNADSNFLLLRLNFGIEHQIAIAAEGTGQHVLSLKKFKGIVAMFPSVQEQEKIGTFLDQLDNLITLHQRKLNHLQLQKKSLLQQMFV